MIFSLLILCFSMLKSVVKLSPKFNHPIPRRRRYHLSFQSEGILKHNICLMIFLTPVTVSILNFLLKMMIGLRLCIYDSLPIIPYWNLIGSWCYYYRSSGDVIIALPTQSNSFWDRVTKTSTMESSRAEVGQVSTDISNQFVKNHLS